MFLKPGGRHHPVGSFAGCVEGRGGGLGVPGDDGGSRQGYGVRLPLLPQLQRHHPGGSLLDPLARDHAFSIALVTTACVSAGVGGHQQQVGTGVDRVDGGLPADASPRPCP